MNKNLEVVKSIEINAEADKVWDVLTNPEKVKAFLFGTQVTTDWKVGSPIQFTGEYNGTIYKDKGNVLENKVDETLKYNYWSGFSGLEDKPENYSIVTYDIVKTTEGQVQFSWTQQGFSSEEGQQHTANGLGSMLQQIKEIAES